MAILSNGKFYGFLCSVKETGRQLANGVKEYVEDFVSGFAGHGWKIWEYVKGKWMLEIDSIRVRGQFTVFEMLISKVRAIIGAQTITQGCGKIKTVTLSEDGTAYLIILEDEDMSFMEHDFIRCQEFSREKRTYHVEVESVTDGMIRIPVSEFEQNEEGEVMNPPSPGDDIVQFGNSSHDEKYVGRHSAIYMHADETGAPAIDFMADIYSKNWENTIKTRIGGNLPGTDGDRGFYCVNGKIMSVDESNNVVYQINPDGSASFARGKLKWSKDGSPQFTGTILMQVDEKNVWEVDERCIQYIGNKDGKHIEFNPLNSNIVIFDSQNNIVNTFEGNTYENIGDIFEGTIPTLTLVDNISAPSTAMSTANNSSVIKSAIEINPFKEISFYVDGQMTIYVYSTMSCGNSFDGGVGFSSYEIHMMIYNDSALSDLYSDLIILNGKEDRPGGYNIIDSYPKSSLIVGKYYKFIIKMNSEVKGVEAQGNLKQIFSQISVKNFGALIYKNGYVSKFFANGFALGDADNNIFGVFNKTDPWNMVVPTAMNLIFENPAYGLKITDDEVRLKQMGIWGMIPTCIFVAYGNLSGDNGADFSLARSFDGRIPVLERNGEGKGTIVFPVEWRGLHLSYLSYPVITGYGYSKGSTTAPIKATFIKWNGPSIYDVTGFDFELSDDATPNDGKFIVEIKTYG